MSDSLKSINQSPESRPPSLLVGALQTAAMTELLTQQGPFTLFAPTNEAFNALLPAELSQLMGE